MLEIDEDERFIALKLGPSRSRLEAGCSLIPEGPVGDAVLRAAVHRYAQDVAANGRKYSAITAILRRDRPQLTGRYPGQPILPDAIDATQGAIDYLRALADSELLVPGPPGVGKTPTTPLDTGK